MGEQDIKFYEFSRDWGKIVNVKQIIDEDMERDERFKKQFEFAVDSFPKTKDFLRVFRK